MGSVADCFDNSMAEAFFATLETELFWTQPHRRRFTTYRDAKLAIFDYLEVFHNRHRPHTSIGSIPLVTYEARHADQTRRPGSMIHTNPVSTEAGQLHQRSQPSIGQPHCSQG